MQSALALAAMLAALAAFGPARADTREIAGETLVLSNTMSETTIISTDPALSGHVRVSLDGSLSCLSANGGGAAVISTSGCSEESGTLRIDVPPDMPLTITANGGGNLNIGDTHAPLIVTLNGSGNVAGGRAGRLVLSVHGSSDVAFGSVQGGAELEMTGSGDVRLGGVDGTLVLRHHGSGDLAVGQIQAPVLSIESTGSGDMLLGAGSVGTLSVRIQGDGDLALAASVHDAEISAFGGGDVKLGAVTGTVHKSSGDGSDIIIGGPAVVNSVIGKVADAIGNGHSHVVAGSSDHLGHFLTFIAVCVMLFIGWRMIRRGGGFAAWRSPPPQPGVTHPGVAGVMDTLKRVDERLGRVEGYVTSREFDLQQKFKQL